ncbi:MAG: hypothetical protein LBM92_01115 [Opitutaceae bacterium]|jgi:hypothetical protein|nr:hypothetical protein [Opitutaceae bacterium]
MKIPSPSIAIVAAITLLGGCTLPKVSNMTPQQYKDSHIHVSRDDFEKTTTIETSRNYFTKNAPPNPSEAYCLIAQKKDGGAVFYEIMLYSKYSANRIGRVFWSRATDENGTEFSLKAAALDVDYPLIEEWCSAQVSREYLENVRATGIRWRFYGRVTTTARISPQVIDGFLMKVDEMFKE